MLKRPDKWQPRPLHCCDCGCTLDLTRNGTKVNAGAAILPELPGAVCNQCLDHVDGLAVTDLEVEAAVHFILATKFEVKSGEAVQVYLDLFGWEPSIVGAIARRLHADALPTWAGNLLKDAREHGSAGYYDSERAFLLILDGETGKAHDLLTATTVDDHPSWHHFNGILAHSVGEEEAAVEHWRLQIEVNPAEFEGWLPLGFHLMQEAEDFEAGEAHFRQACAQHPGRQECRAWLGDALLRQGRAKEALVELEAALKLDPVDDDFVAGIKAFIAEIREGKLEEE